MSYVSQQFLVFDNSSLANFKNWAQAISSAFSSAGWTTTSDTGQVNWSTIAVVPTSGNFVYEIWQPADALQTGSTTFYVKIQYGTSAGSPAGCRVQINIGSGTDGAGTLTGTVLTNREPMNTTTNGTGSTTYDCYFSGDTDRFAFMMWRSKADASNGQPFGAVIERTKNTDGTNSSDGALLLTWSNWANASSGTGMQTLVFSVGGSNGPTNRSYITIANIANASGAFNNNIPVQPVFPDYGKYGNPITGAAFIHTQDVAEGCLFTVSLYGATRTYIATGNISLTNPANSKLCMRYD
jgi:hypothetical protein